MIPAVKNNPVVIRAWATYDLANSVYNLVITATIFPIYYSLVTTTTNGQGAESSLVDFWGMKLQNTALYDWAISLSYLIVCLLMPVLSGVADFGGNKKSFMKFFCYLGSASCFALYFFDSGNLGFGLLMAMLACIGFAGSLVFYNAYLPEIATPDLHNKVSARGFSMGYWGSAILLMICLGMILTRETGGEKMLMMRYAFAMAGIWWFAFAQIPFYYLPETKRNVSTSRLPLAKGFQELKMVASQIRNFPNLKNFLLAFFLYSMGVQTVMLVANHFGKNEIKMESGQLITTILIIQFVAIAGAYLFSFLSEKLGNISVLKLATLAWALICGGTFLFVFTAVDFYVVAALVGLVMGGIQSLSRSTYSRLLPETDDHASYFSFYDVCEKLSIVLGMAIFGIFNQISQTMRTPIVVLVLFFMAGFLLLFRVRNNLKSDLSHAR